MNKISTQGYFIKRLKDSGYIVDKIFSHYSEADCRVWTVMIDPGNASVFCTYVENDKEIGNNYFELYDNNRFVNGRFKIVTESMEIFIKYLTKLNIINKFNKHKE
jgi:hypothetical protein